MAEGPAGNGKEGKKVFQKNCANCHTMAMKGKSGIGPNLGTVWNRKIGTASGFKYSAGLSSMGKDGKVWNEENLHSWVSNPASFSTGTSMAFAGIKSENDR